MARPGLVQALAQFPHHLDEALREIVLPDLLALLLALLRAGPAARFLHRWSVLKADRQRPCGDALALQRQQQRGLQKTPSQHQIAMKRRRHRIALLERLFDRAAGLARTSTIDGDAGQRPCRRKLREGRYGVVVETAAYDLTVFKVHDGKLTLKICSKGESVLRIEAVVHNAKELCCGLSLGNFPRMVELLRGMLERFLNTLHWLDVCFIAGDTLEGLGSASRVGKSNAGGVDFNRPRMRALVRAVIVLASSPKGFTASEVAREVAFSNPRMSLKLVGV